MSRIKRTHLWIKTTKRDGEPSTPPPSPIGTFKYPALFRGSNVWPKTTSVDAIVTGLCKSSSQNMTWPLTSVHDFIPDDKKQFQKVQPQPLQTFFDGVRPARGETKMYLWPQPEDTDWPKLDLSSLTQTGSRPEGVCKLLENPAVKKSRNLIETGDMKEDIIARNKASTILKHAVSHDPVMAKHSSAPQIQRSMTFSLSEKPKGVLPLMKRDSRSRNN